jgi:hypothetical protein
MRNGFSLLFTAACGALASSPAAGARVEAPAATKADDRVICKKAAPAGTRFRTETCYTMAEWDKISEAARRDMGEMVLRDPKKRVRRTSVPSAAK